MVRTNWLRKLSLGLTVAAGLALVLNAQGCKTAPKSGGSSDEVAGASADENTMGDSDSGRAMGLQTVHFPYDSIELDDAAKAAIATNVDVLKKNAKLKVQIEGHCDQRGGIQYNIALGERRANAVRKIMTSQGIKGNRITTISYGKEKPADPAENEAAYAKNRRANFVITAK